MRRHQRAPSRPLDRTSRFRVALRALNARVDQLLPLVAYQDSRGRQRSSGAGRRARARACLDGLIRLQNGCRSAELFAGFAKVGRSFGRSRSTGYRALLDLREMQLIEYEAGGGKRRDERGQLVPWANTYRLAAWLQEEPVRSHRPSRLPDPQQRGRGVAELQDRVEHWRELASANRARAPDIA